jgi:hypothetical protein
MTRYERVLAVAKEIDAVVAAKSKARADVTRFLETLRGSKELPKHCEWAERARDEWFVNVKAERLFEALEDLVNFHPTMTRMGVYDEKDEKEDYTTQEFQTRFDAAKVGYIQWQIDLDHEEEQYGDITIDIGWKLTKDGVLVEEGSWDSRIESSWSDSSHSFSWGAEEPGAWPPGTYAIALSLWDEPLGEVKFTVEGEAPGPKEEKEVVAAITSDRRDRYARILELVEALEKKSSKIKKLASEIREACAKRSLPKHVEWAEEQSLGGEAARLLERIEDLVNFHPKLERLGFFDQGGDPEPKYGQPFEKRFDADKTHFITWQIELDHPDAQYGEVELELRWRFTQPDGSTDDEQTLATAIQATWSNSFHFVTCGERDVEWPPGKYILRVALFDEPFAEATMFVDESGGSL